MHANTVAIWVVLLVLFSGLALNGTLERNAHDSQRMQAQVLADSATARINGFVHERLSALGVMARNWPQHHPNVPLWFSQHAADLMEVLPGIQAIAWYSGGGDLQAVQGAKWQPFDTFASLAEAGMLAQRWPQGLSVWRLSLPSQPFQPEQTAFLMPMQENTLDHGALLMVIDPRQLASSLLAPMVGFDFTLDLITEGKSRLRVGEAAVLGDEAFARGHLELGDQYTSEILVYANASAYRARHWILGFALIAALLLGWTIRLSMIRQQRLSLSQQRFKAASAASLDGLLIFAPDALQRLVVVEANPKAERLLGRPLAELLSATLDTVAGWLQSPTLQRDCLQVFKTQQQIERRYAKGNGQQWLKLQVVHNDGLVAVTVRDVSQRMWAQQELKQREEKYRRLVEGLDSHIIYAINAQGELDYISNTLQGLLGWQSTATTRRIERLLQHRRPDRLRRYHQLLAGHSAAPFRLRLRHCDGDLRTLEFSESLVFDGKGNCLGFEGIATDISAADKLQQQVLFQAHHDALTGLYNRYHFDACIQRMLAERDHQGPPLWLFYFDLDQFKAVNDSCGHIAGDALLRQLTQHIKLLLPVDSEFARLGGDEFAIIVAFPQESQAMHYCETLIKSIREFRFGWDGKLFQIGASGGLVAINAHFSSADELMRAADAACYIAKERGRNRIHLHADDAATQHRHLELHWYGRLRRALEQHQFELFMQPIRRLTPAGNGYEHYEVLLRLRDEHQQLVSPAIFIPAAERYGVMPDIDLWVVAHTLQMLAEHPQHVARLDCCSINLSAATLSQANVTSQIIALVTQHQALADKICFEITETSAISLLEDAQQFIRQLKSLGCRFALDDFGAGMTSFSYLKDLPVDYLKIDGQFVRQLADDAVDQAVVRAFRDVGKSLGMALVAEFVSSQPILDVLCEIGIDYAQGYVLGKPQPLKGYLYHYRPAQECA